MLNKFSLLLWTVFIFFYSDFAQAQSQEFSVFQLRFIYNEANFNDVIKHGRLLLEDTGGLGHGDLQEIHKYMALSFYNISQQDSSRFHFYSLLSLNPQFELDPVQTSPKIISFFSQLKVSFNKSFPEQTVVKYTEYIFQEDIRPQAALRSLVLPGWGQFYKHHDSKGYILGGAFLTTAVSALISYSMEENRKEAYLEETNPQKIKSRYDEYNNMSKLRKTLQYAAVVVWLASISDALFWEYTPQVHVLDKSVGLSYRIQL